MTGGKKHGKSHAPAVTGEAHQPQTELSCTWHAGILGVTKPRLRWGCDTAFPRVFLRHRAFRPGETVTRLRAVWSTFFNDLPLCSMAGFIDTGSGCKACRGGCSRCTGRCRNCIGMLTISHIGHSSASMPGWVWWHAGQVVVNLVVCVRFFASFGFQIRQSHIHQITIKAITEKHNKLQNQD